MNLKKIFFITIVVFFSVSCNTNKKSVTELIYSNRELILKTFSNKSIIKSRKGNIIILSYHSNDSTNRFYFEAREHDFFLLKDSLQYPLNGIFEGIDTIKAHNPLKYDSIIIVEFKKLISLMDSMGISDLSSEFTAVGINLKIYIGQNEGAMLYVKRKEGIVNERWKEYVNNAKRFDENWYYVNE